MAKLLGLLVLVGLGWLVVKRMLGPTPIRREPQQPRFEKTVRCKRCGVHLPLALAHAEGDAHVCNDANCHQRTEHESRR